MKKNTKFELYIDTKKEFRWKLLSKNGESVAIGGEGYSTKRSAMNAIKKLREWAITDEIIDSTK
jgi:uncharacterized protein YegP (UPF0339 family)